MAAPRVELLFSLVYLSGRFAVGILAIPLGEEDKPSNIPGGIFWV
jgi:hypothetical protein